MEAFKTIIWIINIFSSLAIIALVLMQHGKGAEAGASFGGSGSAQGVFGSGGNANFLSRMTGVAATVFFASCLALGYVNSKASGKVSDFSDVQQSQVSGSLHHNLNAEMASPVAVAASSASGQSSVATAAAIGTAAAVGKMAADKAQDKEKNKKVTKEKSNTENSSKNATNKNQKSVNNSNTKDNNKNNKKADKDNKVEKKASNTSKKSEK